MNIRRIASYFLACLMVFQLMGCQSKAPDSQELVKISQMQERRIGSLQSLGGAFVSTGATHLLRMEDGKNLYLKSQKLDLADQKYLNKTIEVMGEIVRTTDGNQIMNVSSIDVLEQENLSEDFLPQWVDYRSDNLALSFKYRDDFSVSEEDNKVIIERKDENVDENATPGVATSSEVEGGEAFAKSEGSEIVLELLNSDPAKLLEEMGVKSGESSDILAGGFTKSKITQKALEAYKRVDSDDSITYFTGNSGGVYRIAFEIAEDEKDKVGFQNMFFDIMASIEFGGETAEDSINEEIEMVEETDVETNTDYPISDGESAKMIEGEQEPDEEENVSGVSTSTEMSGFTTFQSESAGFSIQYPKSYYFGQASEKPSDSTRSYEFGTEPVEEEPGDIVLDVVKGEIPSGSKIVVNGRSMTKVQADSLIQLYTESDGKIFRISGPSGKLSIMQQMLSTVE